MFDVIIIGARVAGSATAMLLARRGLSVLVVDRAAFPSDTLSTHQVQVPGVARLRRWGLLDRVAGAGTPATRRVHFDPGPAVLDGCFPAYDGVDALYSPRRTVLDSILVDAAREAGAELRENVAVTELLADRGDRVAGVRLRTGTGPETTERGRLVVGADGKHSLVARSVGAEAYREKPAMTVASYTYWAGVPLDGGEIYARDRRAVGAWPTNDGLTMTYVAWPLAEFAAFRADVEGNLLRTLDLAGDLGERVRAGSRTERIRTTPDVPNAFRVPYGPGWALVGDAGLVMDPITGQGIADAFRDAELLAGALAAGLGGRQPLDAALSGYHRERDARAVPMYEFTAELASLVPNPAGEVLFRSLAGRQAEIDLFLGVITGSGSVAEFRSPRHMLRLLGVRGLARVLLATRRARRSPPVASAVAADPALSEG